MKNKKEAEEESITEAMTRAKNAALAIIAASVTTGGIAAARETLEAVETVERLLAIEMGELSRIAGILVQKQEKLGRTTQGECKSKKSDKMAFLDEKTTRKAFGKILMRPLLNADIKGDENIEITDEMIDMLLLEFSVLGVDTQLSYDWIYQIKENTPQESPGRQYLCLILVNIVKRKNG